MKGRTIQEAKSLNWTGCAGPGIWEECSGQRLSPLHWKECNKLPDVATATGLLARALTSASSFQGLGCLAKCVAHNNSPSLISPSQYVALIILITYVGCIEE